MSEKRVRTQQVGLRLLPEEEENLRKRAEKRGMTVQEYLRASCATEED